MSIYKRGKTYTANVSVTTSQGRKRVTKSGFKTKREAQTWSTEQEFNKNSGKAILDKSIYLADFVDKWASLYKPDASQPMKSWYAITSKNIREYLPDFFLNDVTRMQLQNMFNKMGEKYSIESLSKQKKIISAVYNEAIFENIANRNPIKGIKLIGKAGKEDNMKFLEERDMLNLINYIKLIPEDKMNKSDLLILSAIDSGARYEELAALTWKDIDNNSFNIYHAWDELNHSFKPVKTGNSERLINMPNSLIDFLTRFKGSSKIDDFIFKNAGEYPITNAAANKRLKKILTEIHSQKIITFHGLRHTHASYLLSKGIDIQYVSERLGHANVNITLRVYTHLMESSRKDEAEKSTSLFENL